jgi:hypothetical protein
MGGFLVETTASCKAGRDSAHDRTWGDHALVLTPANISAVLGLVNRPASRPAHEGAATEVDRALAACFRSGCRQVRLRGDTDFAQTEHLDRGNADARPLSLRPRRRPEIGRLGGRPPERAWRLLQRPPRYEVHAWPRERPDNVKEAVVICRGFANSNLFSEPVAEFNYRPTA